MNTCKTKEFSLLDSQYMGQPVGFFIKNEIKSEHQLFTVLTVELLSELWNVKVCPQHIQMSMVHLCIFAALRSILLWNDDNYDKVMKVIRKAILCCIIEKQENHQYPHFFIIWTHNIRWTGNRSLLPSSRED